MVKLSERIADAVATIFGLLMVTSIISVFAAGSVYMWIGIAKELHRCVG